MEKEFNPALQFDAFTAGIENGGLRSSSSISIIVCYIIANCKHKVTAKNIIDAMVIGKMANYFEISSAVAKMTKKGYIKEDEDGYLTVTNDCRFLIDLVENDLPYTIRQRSVSLVTKLAVLDINKKENKVTIEKKQKGYCVTMHVSDVDCDFMELKLYVASEAQAAVIKEKFEQNPAKIYENLVDSIFDENELEEE